jgi:1-acyl-sn-glycerol-3-phosphate acyltransferase
MGLLYRICRRVGRGIFFCTLRTAVENRHATQREGGFVLAVTHISHLEPFCSSALNARHIDWIARKELFKLRPVAWLLRSLNAIRIDRQGRPVSALRTAIHRIRAGRVVGIFPEGGVLKGADAAIRGGAIKKGCCSIAIRAGAPIVPCVMLGTDKLNAVKPWLPFRRGRIWVAYGDPIYPPAGARSTRATREELAAEIRAAFGELYARLRDRHQICDSTVP